VLLGIHTADVRSGVGVLPDPSLRVLQEDRMGADE
jgi:hypothetical protein